jgi:hypothetical protein
VSICDDLRVTSRCSRDIKAFHSDLCKLFGAVTYYSGKVHSYLGQTFDFKEPLTCKITMERYASYVLGSEKEEGLFNLGEGETLDDSEKAHFQSTLAKLLYLAKRARPDLLTAMTFPTTRVWAPTIWDNYKFDRVRPSATIPPCYARTRNVPKCRGRPDGDSVCRRVLRVACRL